MTTAAEQFAQRYYEKQGWTFANGGTIDLFLTKPQKLKLVEVKAFWTGDFLSERQRAVLSGAEKAGIDAVVALVACEADRWEHNCYKLKNFTNNGSICRKCYMREVKFSEIQFLASSLARAGGNLRLAKRIGRLIGIPAGTLDRLSIDKTYEIEKEY